MACKRCEISTFIKDNGVDLFFVTETWLSAHGDEAKTAELAPSGFDVKSFPRQSRSRGGGIATVYKSTLGSSITFKTCFDFTHTSFEVVQASITLQHNTLHFFCLYRHPPNRRNNLTDSMFTEQLPNLLDYVNSLPGHVCLVGDMNIHFDNPLQSLTKQTLSTLSLYDLVQVINKPTHRCGHIIRANIASEHVTSTLVTGTTAATFSSFEKVSQLTVKECILNSAPKSCELDPIPSKLLIECLDSILPSLTDLFNSSLASGISPQCFKSALVTPILKKRCLDHNDLNNYRPVSNLCFIAKILEKLVLSQVSSYLNSHNLYNTCQSAYRPGHSTETALLKVVNDLFLSLNKGNISVLALLDFSSAFDTIDHTILVHRLHTDFGFTDTVLQWFSSYLTDRTQYVSPCNHCSDFAPVHSGVPQGSVLGPMLSPCILSLCLPLLTHTLSYIIHMLMTYNYRCLLPQIEYLSYFTLCSHV